MLVMHTSKSQLIYRNLNYGYLIFLVRQGRFGKDTVKKIVSLG
jgi:hypothetical protein